MLFVALLGALMPAATARAQFEAQGVGGVGGVGGPPESKVSAALNFDRVQPGQQAVVAIVLEVPEGYHGQSSEPLLDFLVPFNISVDEFDGVTVYAPIYAKGHIENYPLVSPDTNGDMSVYTGRTVHYLPIEVSADARPGETITLTGKAVVQNCDDSLCYQPETLKWSVQVIVAGEAETVNPANTELFDDFDPATWSNLKPLDPTTTATTTAATASTGMAFTLFGWDFDLGNFGVLAVLGFAFVAGILFNVVPCVLPVLPMKIISFYETAEHSRSRCFALGVAFSIGMIAVFAGLAVVLFGFAETLDFNWGEQFSNPWFSGVMALLLIIFAAYQFGFLTFVLPAKVYAITPRHDTYTGNVGFGAMTAVLSTPCTFGLFAALLAWAATQPTWLGIAVVTMTGVGMAAPYLVLSAFPGVARKFPRTGAWSEVIKQVGAFLILAVAIYFAKTALRPILPEVIAGASYWWIIFAPILIGCVFLVIAAIRIGGTRAIVTTTILSAILLAITSPIFYRLANPPAGWTYYNEAALAEARATNRPVLLKFTADWCLNCQTVEQRVFGTQEQMDGWADDGLHLLKADLTAEDAAGWPLLKELNPARSIPFTAVYLPGEDQPRALTGIYGEDDLRAVLELIGG